MAEAAAKSVLGTISQGHLECPICRCRFADPKMLDCLHIFCLNCLQEFTTRAQPKADEITCPVCRRATAVPNTGLQGLPNCFFLSSLVDKLNKQERLLEAAPADTRTCEECDDGLEAVSRCLDCDGNICQKCLDTHQKMKSTKKHRIVNLDQSGEQVHLEDLLKNDSPRCNKRKHTSYELCFYCETCKTLACAKCAALDHRTAEHEYREVGVAIRSYRQDVCKILQRFDKKREEFKVADDLLTHARNRLKIMVARACKDITAKEEEEIAKIRNKSCLLIDKVTQIGQERDREFEEVQKSNRDKMEQAKQIVGTVNDLMHQADDFELLDLKPKVMHNLEFQEELELEHAQHELSFIGVKCQDVVKDTDLGEVCQVKEWTLMDYLVPKDGSFACAAGVACLGNDDLAVTDTGSSQDLLIFTCNITGQLEHKSSVSPQYLNEPVGVAVTSDDLLLITDEKYVKVFDSSLKFIRQFAPSQDDANGDTESLLGDIAVDKEDRIAVIDSERKVISMHHLDGSLITTVPHDMIDDGSAIAISEHLIFTNKTENNLICITLKGVEVFNVNTSLDGEPVQPLGVCYDDDDFFVSVLKEGKDGQGEVHRYSPEGVFIGRVAGGLECPIGLTLSQSGHLVVADMCSVRIFQRPGVRYDMS